MFSKDNAGPLCHHDKKPCIRERCVKWQTAPVEKVVDNVRQTVMHADCADVWVLLYLKAVSARTEGTQQAVESARNEARKDTVALASVLLRRPVDFRDGLLIDVTPGPMNGAPATLPDKG